MRFIFFKPYSSLTSELMWNWTKFNWICFTDTIPERGLEFFTTFVLLMNLLKSSLRIVTISRRSVSYVKLCCETKFIYEVGTLPIGESYIERHCAVCMWWFLIWTRCITMYDSQFHAAASNFRSAKLVYTSLNLLSICILVYWEWD